MFFPFPYIPKYICHLLLSDRDKLFQILPATLIFRRFGLQSRSLLILN